MVDKGNGGAGSEVEVLRAALDDAKRVIQEQASKIEEFSQPPLGYATVLAVHKKGSPGFKPAPGLETGRVTILYDGKPFDVSIPNSIPLKPGDSVNVHPGMLAILAPAITSPIGSIAHVRRILAKTLCEVDSESGTRLVYCQAEHQPEKGDRVVLDPSSSVITSNLGKVEERFSLAHETEVTWDDIGGLVDAKREMREAVESPHLNADLFRYYKKRPVKGLLLWGPPGNGKTLLGKAAATSLRAIYFSSAGGADCRTSGVASSFIHIKGPEILDRYVGVAEAAIRGIFERARKHQRDYGYPAVIFIDEADAILGRRGSGISSDMERTIVPMFLTEMDGMDECGAIVILATNRADILDPAIVRDGRIDRRIRVGRPDQDAAAQIFRLNLRNVPLANGDTVDDLAHEASAELFSPMRILYNIQIKDLGSRVFTMREVVNGGMVAGIVARATSLAMRRDISAPAGRRGLMRSDLIEAIDLVERENREASHEDALVEFIGEYRDRVVSVQRLKATN